MSKYEARRLDAEQWYQLSENAHKVVFGVNREAELERIDFALLILVDDELGGYFTCKEFDAETLYIQYGGVFPNFKGTIHTLPGYRAMIEWVKKCYPRSWTKIENTNAAMLKMALQVGFRPTGVASFKGKLFVEMSMGDI